MAPRPRKTTSSRVEKGRVRVHDPFELVRWLALSQPDPRKAVAELVQNSLDAKEVVLRSSQDPRLEAPLEQMVEVTAYADRQLTERPPTGRRRSRKDSPDD